MSNQPSSNSIRISKIKEVLANAFESEGFTIDWYDDEMFALDLEVDGVKYPDFPIFDLTKIAREIEGRL